MIHDFHCKFCGLLSIYEEDEAYGTIRLVSCYECGTVSSVPVPDSEESDFNVVDDQSRYDVRSKI